jgi:hypothetical protein
MPRSWDNRPISRRSGLPMGWRQPAQSMDSFGARLAQTGPQPGGAEDVGADLAAQDPLGPGQPPGPDTGQYTPAVYTPETYTGYARGGPVRIKPAKASTRDYPKNGRVMK